MRIQLLSDLHFEFHRDGGRAFTEALDPSSVDVLVLARDIAVAGGIPPPCSRYRDAHVVYVHGITFKPNLVWLDARGAPIGARR